KVEVLLAVDAEDTPVQSRLEFLGQGHAALLELFGAHRALEDRQDVLVTVVGLAEVFRLAVGLRRVVGDGAAVEIVPGHGVVDAIEAEDEEESLAIVAEVLVKPSTWAHRALHVVARVGEDTEARVPSLPTSADQEGRLKLAVGLFDADRVAKAVAARR